MKKRYSCILKTIINFVIISICIFFQNNNFYLKSAELLKGELENISFDATSLIITINQLVNKYNIGLLIALIFVCIVYLLFPSKNKYFKMVERIFFLSIIGLIIFVLIFTLNIENLTIYPLIIFVFCTLSLCPFPYYFPLIIQITIYLCFLILTINNLYCLLNWMQQKKN